MCKTLWHQVTHTTDSHIIDFGETGSGVMKKMFSGFYKLYLLLTTKIVSSVCAGGSKHQGNTGIYNTSKGVLDQHKEEVFRPCCEGQPVGNADRENGTGVVLEAV